MSSARSSLQHGFETWRARLPLEITLALGLGFVLAILGPYDTSQFPLLPRAGYWIGLVTAWFLVAGVVEAVLRLLPFSSRWNPAAILIATYLIAGVPMTALVWIASVELTNGSEVMRPLVLYGQTLLVGSGASLIGRSLLPASDRETVRQIAVPEQSALSNAQTVSAISVSLSRLEARLPVHLRGAIMVLASEDHYVRVYTRAASHLLLMRLSDAIDEMDDTPGERVHRSWWVAASASCEFQPRGRTAVLRVAGVVDVPVSTPYLKVAEDIARRG